MINDLKNGILTNVEIGFGASLNPRCVVLVGQLFAFSRLYLSTLIGGWNRGKFDSAGSYLFSRSVLDPTKTQGMSGVPRKSMILS